MALVEEAGAGADDPEALLNEWLGELTVLTAGLNTSNSSSESSLRPLEIVAPRIDSYRFSMANLEETQDADLDAILGELCALDSECDDEISRVSGYLPRQPPAEGSEQARPECLKDCSDTASSIARTDSPDNDSAFSDTVSMLSSESSASSSAGSKCKALKLILHQNQKDASFQQKADKIKLALERMREASVKKLFIKAFSADGSSKSLLVDEKMSCGYVTRLLADKNHVSMEPKWAIVEHLPDLYMERVYEDHEVLVDNLMLWTRESKNRILFAERPDKIAVFQTPERFLLAEDDRGFSSEHDDHSRQVILEDFFGQSTGATSILPSIAGHSVPQIEGPLYLKSEAKKGWKKYHFVLRPSGLYYSPKDKAKTLKELVCLATFETNEVYLGVNWRKKYKSPTDHCFAIKHPRLQQPKSVKFIKFLCADDAQVMERWVTAIRIAKHGRRLLENYRSLVEELTQDDLDHLAHARSCSITSLPAKSAGGAAAAGSPSASCASSSVDTSSGRHSRASSSSSSGCLSDGGTASESAFDCEFPMGTIKRKPSMKPNIPLTWMTRQLKEMAEKGQEGPDGGTLTRRPRARVDDHTLTRHHSIETTDSSIYSVGSGGAASSPAPLYAAGPVYATAGPVYAPPAYAPPVYAAPDQLPPPPDAMFSSTLSLDSLPPPPPPAEPVDDLPLPPPPPDHYAACLAELQAPPPPDRKAKKISFNLPGDPPASPRKPPPPRRCETTRLSSPKKLADSASNPPKDFLKDLQRVMRKKWQVAQKCKLEPAATPHEVLGFREYPRGEREASVSMWLQEHYGPCEPCYENWEGAAGGAGAVGGAGVARSERRRPPPPAPPRRADSTHLTHAPPSTA
ncbi:amyloid beta A4 precursor protein-binding family B member 1-interacting protein isoform X1 [Plutella xylostella]|uniref:amyloid beta A4 precursor protein-binding family B member 1-interacting protein isoform X1 n=1 Tax=Plutella xylostella TaxID=51655 RepID=UPI002032FBBE|nr:amyloid beta A4 precursor protein-binding family B member 1-interacting protein isoform X1 [Plutella xylostella]XP_048488453.1 amyloid beta A4 precursor protein-binding family B member 1-interacting protein isoform X1 [Plutella xylostella]